MIAAKITGPVNRELLAGTVNDLLLGRTVGEIKTGEVQKSRVGSITSGGFRAGTEGEAIQHDDC